MVRNNHIKFDIATDQRANPKLPPAYVHSDVYVTMTGFTRFMHENDAYSLSTMGWTYNKTENMPDSEYGVYTHLITDRTNYTGFHIYGEPVKQFVRLDITNWLKNPFKNSLLVLEDKVYMLERDDIAKLRK